MTDEEDCDNKEEEEEEPVLEGQAVLNDHLVSGIDSDDENDE